MLKCSLYITTIDVSDTFRFLKILQLFMSNITTMIEFLLLIASIHIFLQQISTIVTGYSYRNLKRYYNIYCVQTSQKIWLTHSDLWEGYPTIYPSCHSNTKVTELWARADRCLDAPWVQEECRLRVWDSV